VPAPGELEGEDVSKDSKKVLSDPERRTEIAKLAARAKWGESDTSIRDERIDACVVANQLWYDILGADGILQHFDQYAREHLKALAGEHRVAVQRIVFFSIVQTLCRFVEFYDRYQRVLPNDCRARLKEFVAGIKGRPVWTLRSKVIAHLLDRGSGRPLRPAEVDALSQEVLGGDSEAFLRRIRNPRDAKSCETLFGSLSWTIGRMRHDFSISPQELGLIAGPSDDGPIPPEA
jgi:hypothetical protein